MCIVVDVNALAVFFTNNDCGIAIEYLNNRKTKLALGGKLLDEYSHAPKYLKIIGEYEKIGATLPVNDKNVRDRTQELIDEENCKSDDEHIIALAQVGGVRILCSYDNDLCHDFKSKKLLDNPRGKIFRNNSHQVILDNYCKCN